MEEKRYLRLGDIEAYKIGFHLSNYLWRLVIGWKQFEKNTVGQQFVRAVDSISANIAEGFGRFHKRDKVKFYKYAYGSAIEALDWNQKSKVRSLIKEEEYTYILNGVKEITPGN